MLSCNTCNEEMNLVLLWRMTEGIWFRLGDPSKGREWELARCTVAVGEDLKTDNSLGEGPAMGTHLALLWTWISGIAGPGKFQKEEGKVGEKRQTEAISSEPERLKWGMGILCFSVESSGMRLKELGKCLRTRQNTWVHAPGASFPPPSAHGQGPGEGPFQ